MEHVLLLLQLLWIKIETYWNVNQNVQEIAPMVFIIKIETYWNVNFRQESTASLITTY